MTLCIAAICDATTSPKIVGVSDQMICFGDRSSDRIALKSEPLHKNWYALYASNNVGHVPLLLEAITKKLRNTASPQAVDVADAVDCCFRERIRKETESAITARHGYSLEQLNARGRDELGETLFRDLHDRIDSINLETDLIVLGFDNHGEPHIFGASGTGQPLEYSSVGFFAVGSGVNPAIDTILFYADKKMVNQNSPMERVVYVSCAAKFMAESVPTVGKTTTFVSLFEADKRICYMRPLFWKEIKKTWESVGMPALPEQMLEQIAGSFRTGQECQEEFRRLAAQKSEPEQ